MVYFDDSQITFVLAGRIRFSLEPIQLDLAIPEHLLLLVFGRVDRALVKILLVTTIADPS